LISIIIPVLNEALVPPAILRTLSKVKGLFKIIIADGRSSDATRTGTRAAMRKAWTFADDAGVGGTAFFY
jgi:glycosyltransferase involved in cell wall biosynthesis